MADEDAKNDSSSYEKDNEENEINFKLIIIGNQGVGKSSLTIRAIKNTFEEFYTPTIGFDFQTHYTKIEDKKIKLQIWDTCGQEGYRALITSFYRNASLAILVYSIDSQKSFDSLEDWLNDIKTQSNPETKIVLIGNKSDLEEKREVSKEKGQQFCELHQCAFFMEASAKKGDNVQNLFEESAKILYEKFKEYKDKKNPNNIVQDATSEPISIEDSDNNKKIGGKCWC